DGTQVNFTEIERIICFADGTMIDTPRGPYPIEQLAPGDLVLTLENGPVPIRWHGRRVVVGHGDAAPIRFGPGTLGNARPLLVSPQHRILVTDHRAQLNFGEDEILVPAKALIDGRGVFPSPVERIAYHHILFDTHQIIWANGVPTESYHPGAYSLDGLGEEARDALFSVFPNLRSDPNGYGPSARPAVRVEAGRILAA
ncbi:MAG: Hint domain-containing protein, partial [Pseudomonadota bacterium]